MLSIWFGTPLWKRILVALVLGMIVGYLLGESASSIRWIGDLFMRLIRMVVVPLIFLTLVSGVVAMGDPSKLGSLGVKTLGIYIGTTAVAITIGLVVVVILQPGAGAEISSSTTYVVQEAQPLVERLLDIVPENVFEALARGNFLAIIFFALLFGIGLLTTGEKAKPVADFIDAGSEVMLKITHWVMEVAPFGVFALIASLTGSDDAEKMLELAAGLAITVVIACVSHVIIVHGGLMKFFLKLSPLKFFSGAREAMLMAFSTSSSSATLPVTMSVAENNLGVKPIVVSTVLPLGATINMDGTALYVGIVTVFAAQAFGVDLTFADYVLIAAITTLVSIGTAAVPSASLFLMPVVMGEVGISPEQIATMIGFILIIDRPLDMLRTSVNITGDLAVATVVANWEDEFDKDVFDAPTDL